MTAALPGGALSPAPAAASPSRSPSPSPPQPVSSQPSSGKEGALPPRKKARSRWKRIRPNAIIGRIVPSLLLVYVVSTYSLVVKTWLYEQLYLREGRRVFAVAYGGMLHALFFLLVLAYLRVFLAREAPAASMLSSDRAHAQHTVSASASASADAGAGAPLVRLLTSFEPLALRGALPAVPDEAAFDKVRRGLVHECAPDGGLMRCWRDGCAGRWKPARTRHCGDCRQCRIGFDHHCPWFDADIVAGGTMSSFLLFLCGAVVLLVLSLGPLAPRAARELGALVGTARGHRAVHDRWWSRRWTWYGGPTLRYGGALWVAARVLREEAAAAASSSSSSGAGAGRASRHLTPPQLPTPTPTPTLRAPLTLLAAALLSAVALGLLYTTLAATARGELSVDVMRRRTHRAAMARKTARRSDASASPSEGPQQDAAAKSKLSAVSYFWVPLRLLEGPEEGSRLDKPGLPIPESVRHAGGLVVPSAQDAAGLTDDVRAYDWGFWRNVALLLEKRARIKDTMQWPVAPRAVDALVRRARESLNAEAGEGKAAFSTLSLRDKGVCNCV